ncbi:MAG: glycine--tRNA ligase subunit beta [Pseudomonadota bacterium]
MPELLLELLSEEIPARMQSRAASDLARLVSDGLKGHGLTFEEIQSYATPRRLMLVIGDLPPKSPEINEERKGPRVGAPDKAVQGFLRGAGLASLDEAEIVSDAKKGDYYVARISKPGRATPELVAEVVTDVCAKFPWPKSMRWGSSDFTWVRPLQSVLCLFDGRVVPFAINGLEASNVTMGHRFHGNAPIQVSSFADYGGKLRDAKVLLPASERRAMIEEQALELASDAQLSLVEDAALLDENAGLAEWPTVHLGAFDEAFLAVPAECLITSMRSHQKCFSLRDPKTGALANRFLLVSNLIAADDGATIVSGNEKVINARLSDAKFFWEKDLATKLEPMRQQLANITFHAKLGTQADRVDRITELARQVAGSVDAEPDLAGRAAQLCKADLVSEMVGEFPELQGLMGRYYAAAEGMNAKVAGALEAHYKPRGAGDDVPNDAVAIAVALADKLDTLVGFWAIDEKPTGSGDPYQLRRAALGVIRICLENDLRIGLLKVIKTGQKQLQTGGHVVHAVDVETADDLLSFFADRLTVYLREQGRRHDLIDAVFALDGQDDLALIVKRVEALSEFLETDDGANLLAGTKRAANILRAEEKKDGKSYDGKPDGKLLVEPAERALEAAIAKVRFDTAAAINVENFEGAMSALAELRAPVDAFFDGVTVNADDKKLRDNRLRLLAEIRTATLQVADFSKVSG